MKADTPPGLTVTATVELIGLDGKRLVFKVKAHNGVDLIARGRRERFVINREQFDARLEKKKPWRRPARTPVKTRQPQRSRKAQSPEVPVPARSL